MNTASLSKEDRFTLLREEYRAWAFGLFDNLKPTLTEMRLDVTSSQGKRLVLVNVDEGCTKIDVTIFLNRKKGMTGKLVSAITGEENSLGRWTMSIFVPSMKMRRMAFKVKAGSGLTKGECERLVDALVNAQPEGYDAVSFRNWEFILGN